MRISNGKTDEKKTKMGANHRKIPFRLDLRGGIRPCGHNATQITGPIS